MARDSWNGRLLFHGTRYANQILSENPLVAAGPAPAKVCLSRSFNVAAYWASMPRKPDEGAGAILVLDKASLAADGYATEPVIDADWYGADEHEEAVFGSVENLAKHLVGALPLPASIPIPERAVHDSCPALTAYGVTISERGYHLSLQNDCGVGTVVELSPDQLEDLAWMLDEALAE